MKKTRGYSTILNLSAKYDLSVRTVENKVRQIKKQNLIKTNKQFNIELEKRLAQAVKNKKHRQPKNIKQDFIFYNSFLIFNFMWSKSYKWYEQANYSNMQSWRVIKCEKDKFYNQKVKFKCGAIDNPNEKPLFTGFTWEQITYLNALYNAYQGYEGQSKTGIFNSCDSSVTSKYKLVPLDYFCNILFPHKRYDRLSQQVKIKIYKDLTILSHKISKLELQFFGNKFKKDEYKQMVGAEYFLFSFFEKINGRLYIKIYLNEENIFTKVEKQNRLVAIPHEALTGLKNIKNYHLLQMYIAWRVFTAKNKHNHMKTQINIQNMFSRYTGKVTIHVVRDYFQFLKDNNFIQDFEFNKRSSVSWTYPENKKQSIIIIKDENKNLIEKEKTEEIKETEKDIDDVNKFTSKYTVTCGKKRLQTVLHAVYNNNDWSQGGRLYTGLNGHQGLSEEDRATIKINGKSTVEVDFSCFHPHLIYALEGVNYQDDAYSFWIQRNVAKKAFNIALNAKNKEQAILALKKEIKQSCAVGNAEQIFEYMQNRHQAIKQYFFSGAGVRLQNQDAKIALQILKTMKSKRICCLPIHDSFIVQTKHEQTLKQVMLNTYKEFTGFEIDLKSKSMVQA